MLSDVGFEGQYKREPNICHQIESKTNDSLMFPASLLLTFAALQLVKKPYLPGAVNTNHKREPIQMHRPSMGVSQYEYNCFNASLVIHSPFPGT